MNLIQCKNSCGEIVVLGRKLGKWKINEYKNKPIRYKTLNKGDDKIDK